MREPHSKILSDTVDKAAYPPLVEVADAVVVCYLSHNKPCQEMQHQCIQISSRNMRTGMYVFCVDLTSRTGIHQRHALHRGEGQITKKVSIGTIRDNTSQRGTMRAPRQCTKVSCLICDGVGQSR